LTNIAILWYTRYAVAMSGRASVNISLPESMREWVEQTVAHGGYGNVSEYFRELVRADQQKRERERIDAMLIQAIGSGSREWTKDDWMRIRREVSDRLAKRSRKKAG
jgi:antitoxin ParD1/3/4